MSDKKVCRGSCKKTEPKGKPTLQVSRYKSRKSSFWWLWTFFTPKIWNEHPHPFASIYLPTGWHRPKGNITISYMNQLGGSSITQLKNIIFVKLGSSSPNKDSLSQWTLKKKFELFFSLLNMESPKVQKVSHWLSKKRTFQSTPYWYVSRNLWNEQ